LEINAFITNFSESVMARILETESTAYDDWIIVEPDEPTAILPGDVDLTSNFTRNIKLKLPIVSSPMDTVTESEMAIQMALHGGIGIIHRNLTVEEQVRQIEKVKRFRSGIVETPYVIGQDKTLADLRKLIEESGKSRFPVTHDGTVHGKLVGIVTDKDADFQDPSGLVKQHMTTKDLVTAPAHTNLEEAKRILITEKKDLLPLVDGDGFLKAIVTRSDIKKSKDYPYASKDSKERLLVGVAISVADVLGDQTRLKELIKAGTDVIVIDASVGQSKSIADAVKIIKSSYQVEVIAGNVVSKSGIASLAKAGADAVRVGRGVGQSCITSKVVGIGRGQAMAVMDCALEAAKHGIPIIADGGIKYPGHASMAFALGTGSIMMGGSLACAAEAPDPPGYKRQKRGDVLYKLYRGMGSSSAIERGQEVSAGRYAQSKMIGNVPFSPEGVDVELRITGPVSQILDQYRAGVSKAISSIGARNLEEFRHKVVIERVSDIAQLEGHPAFRPVHDEPNYQSNTR